MGFQTSRHYLNYYYTPLGGGQRQSQPYSRVLCWKSTTLPLSCYDQHIHMRKHMAILCCPIFLFVGCTWYRWPRAPEIANISTCYIMEAVKRNDRTKVFFVWKKGTRTLSARRKKCDRQVRGVCLLDLQLYIPLPQGIYRNHQPRVAPSSHQPALHCMGTGMGDEIHGERQSFHSQTVHPHQLPSHVSQVFKAVNCRASVTLSLSLLRVSSCQGRKVKQGIIQRYTVHVPFWNLPVDPHYQVVGPWTRLPDFHRRGGGKREG